MATHTYAITWNNGGSQFSQSVALTDEGEININGDDGEGLDVPNGSTDLEVDVSFTTAGLTSIFIWSDQDLTIETNSGSEAADEISITANKPFWWYSGCGIDNPFGTNVTAFFVTNSSGSAAHLKIFGLKDVTP